ncbi:MAG TPA: acyl carrier protein [Bacteriovoracaceae bacterium]|nr:acyl carrier protein [Bacteriovoracaceae bacterium]
MKVSEEQIKSLIVEICQIDEDKITHTAKLKEDLQMDSLNIADLMASLEEDYEVTVVQEEAMKIKTFGELLEYVKNH